MSVVFPQGVGCLLLYRFSMFLVFVLIGATFIAYPEFFMNSDVRGKFVRDNYQFIVIIVTAFAALITVSIISPKTLVSFLDVFVPTRAFSAAVNEASVSMPAAVTAGLSAKISNETYGLDGNENGGGMSYALQIPTLDKPISADDLIAMFLLRMRKEELRLKRSALSNLIWGVAFAVFGLATLSYPLFFPDTVSSVDAAAFVISYAPRALLALTIALLSFFFLRLYASNEYDLKHTKNETSTFESKVLSAKIASEYGVKASIQPSIDSLALSERNFVLKNGERTISTEVDTKYNDILDALKHAISALPQSEKK